MRDGGTIFALLAMLGAATVLIAWGGWVLDQIDEALDEALRETPEKHVPEGLILQAGGEAEASAPRHDTRHEGGL